MIIVIIVIILVFNILNRLESSVTSGGLSWNRGMTIVEITMARCMNRYGTKLGKVVENNFATVNVGYMYTLYCVGRAYHACSTTVQRCVMKQRE